LSTNCIDKISNLQALSMHRNYIHIRLVRFVASVCILFSDIFALGKVTVYATKHVFDCLH